MNIKDNIRNKRKKENITQTQLGHIVGVAASFISDIETGKKRPSLELLYKLADALNTTPGQLFDGLHDDYDKLPPEVATFEHDDPLCELVRVLCKKPKWLRHIILGDAYRRIEEEEKGVTKEANFKENNKDEQT